MATSLLSRFRRSVVTARTGGLALGCFAVRSGLADDGDFERFGDIEGFDPLLLVRLEGGMPSSNIWMQEGQGVAALYPSTSGWSVPPLCPFTF
ncbi:MAG: hypothetical protein AB7R89_08640 [Dehalococcoidia bacterium]